MAEEQPSKFALIPEPSPPASTLSGANSLESQLDCVGKDEFKALQVIIYNTSIFLATHFWLTLASQEVVCLSAKAHLNIHAGTYRDHLRDRNNMRSFLADVSAFMTY